MSLVNIKRIARHKVLRENISSDEECIDFLKGWWSDKYKLPDNHPLLLEKYLEELLIEYYTDLFKQQPKKLAQFEGQIGENTQGDDEEWFKKVMGDEYTPEDAYSSQFKGELGLKEEVKEKDPYEFEETFETLG